jgi:tetratricopeptide (TPR) repeat protein
VLKTFQNKFLWDEDAVARFQAETELWMRLGSHPNIVRALDRLNLMGKPHVVAEYVHGGPLRKVVGKEPLRSVLEYSIQICWGMSYAVDQAAIIHRDLKPDNVMLTFDGEIKITDFGLASVLPAQQLREHQRQPFSTAQRLMGKRIPEVLAGTLPYMAPELFDDHGNIGVWSDIYAFGATFYELLTGRLAYDHEDDQVVMRMHRHAPLPDPREFKPSLPEATRQIIHRCMEKDPLDRYDSWDTLEGDLQQLYQQIAGVSYVSPFKTDDSAEAERLIELGLTHLRLGDVHEARTAFAEATEYSRHSAMAWSYLGEALLAVWEYHEALKAVEAGLVRAVSRNEYGELYCVRGQIYTKMQKHDLAIAAFDQGLSFTPKDPKLLREKGGLLLRMGQLAEAQRCADQAIRADQFDTLAWRLMGDVQRCMHNPRRAADSYREAIKYAPRDATAWYRYGLCLRQLNQAAEAQKAFEKVQQIEPSYRDQE